MCCVAIRGMSLGDRKRGGSFANAMLLAFITANGREATGRHQAKPLGPSVIDCRIPCVSQASRFACVVAFVGLAACGGPDLL